MIKAVTGAPANFFLFVEGEGDGNKSHDPHVLKTLLRKINVLVNPMGPAYNLENAARAFSPQYNESNRKMMFLIDRDHRRADEVERSWRAFSGPDSANLIIWRKRQLENYFLDPAYLAKSNHLKSGWTKAKLGQEILRQARKRVYLDAANLVIIRIREGFRENWIEKFKNPKGFETHEKALEQILSRKEFPEHEQKVCGQLREDYIKASFSAAVEEFMGTTRTLAFEQGDWMDKINGKPVLNDIISQGFKVTTIEGKDVQGEERLHKVLEDLLSLALDDQPEDFQELHRLITAKVQSG